MHISNPNPQNGKSKFRGIRDFGYKSLHSSPNVASKAGLSLIHSPATQHKFGKRVFMGSYQMSDKDVFDLHMQQIRTKGSLQHFDRESKIKEEQSFSRFVQEQLRNDRQKYELSQKMLQIDFIESNAAKKVDNEERRRQENEKRLRETYQYFPYTGSDEVERKRHELRMNQRREFQQYVN